MKRVLAWLLAGAAVCVWQPLAAQTAAAVREQVQISQVVTGTIEVDGRGKVRAYTIDQPEKLDAGVVRQLQQSVPNWQFGPRPGAEDTLVKASMSIRLVGRRSDADHFAVAIQGVNFGSADPGSTVSGKQRMPPRYPVEAVQARVPGTVYLLLRIDRQGLVEDLAVEQVNLGVVGTEPQMRHFRQVLADASVAAAWHWTFNLPTHGPALDRTSWVVRVPVSYRLAGPGAPYRAEHYGEWQAYVPGPRMTVSWPDLDRDQRSADALPAAGTFAVEQPLKLLTRFDDDAAAPGHS